MVDKNNGIEEVIAIVSRTNKMLEDYLEEKDFVEQQMEEEGIKSE